MTELKKESGPIDTPRRCCFCIRFFPPDEVCLKHNAEVPKDYQLKAPNGCPHFVNDYMAEKGLTDVYRFNEFFS